MSFPIFCVILIRGGWIRGAFEDILVNKDIDMNYVCAVYGVVVAIIVIDWFVRGRRHFRGQTVRHEASAALTGAEHDIVR